MSDENESNQYPDDQDELNEKYQHFPTAHPDDIDRLNEERARQLEELESMGMSPSLLEAIDEMIQIQNPEMKSDRKPSPDGKSTRRPPVVPPGFQKAYNDFL